MPLLKGRLASELNVEITSIKPLDFWMLKEPLEVDEPLLAGQLKAIATIGNRSHLISPFLSKIPLQAPWDSRPPPPSKVHVVVKQIEV